jgi:hypothetical protein
LWFDEDVLAVRKKTAAAAKNIKITFLSSSIFHAFLYHIYLVQKILIRHVNGYIENFHLKGK